MSSKSFEAGYKKYFADRLKNISHGSTEEEIRDLYRDWADQFDKEVFKARGAWYKPMAEDLDGAIKQDFQDKTKDQIKIVDAGAGTGGIGIELHNLGYTDLHALDISQEMLNEAKKKNVYKGFICASLSDQRIPEINTGEFDALICAASLVKGHVHSSAFVEMVRMVKIDGLLCFNIRCNELDDYQDKMLELEKEGIWENVSKKTIPLFESDDMPKETWTFMYRVLKN